MTTKNILVQVRMPQRLVRILDKLSENGIYSSRSEAILDAVRRITLAYEKENKVKKMMLESYLGKKREMSIRDINKKIDPAKLEKAVISAFRTKDPLKIVEAVRR